MKPQLLSGARGQIKVGNNVLGFVTDVSISYNVSVRPVHVLSKLNASSVEPLQAGPVNVTIGRVVPVNTTDGKNAVNSSAIAMGIEPIIAQMLASDDITVELFDKVTGKTVSSVKNCRFAGRSLNVAASQLASERLQLTGIYDAGPSGENTAGKIGF